MLSRQQPALALLPAQCLERLQKQQQYSSCQNYVRGRILATTVVKLF